MIFKAVIAPRDQRTRPVTSAANPATFPETAPTLLLKAQAVAVEDSQQAVADLKNATRYFLYIL